MNQIDAKKRLLDEIYVFQSPRSGRFESNNVDIKHKIPEVKGLFQSPRSGKFESNLDKITIDEDDFCVSIP